MSRELKIKTGDMIVLSKKVEGSMCDEFVEIFTVVDTQTCIGKGMINNNDAPKYIAFWKENGYNVAI